MWNNQGNIFLMFQFAFKINTILRAFIRHIDNIFSNAYLKLFRWKYEPKLTRKYFFDLILSNS